MSDDAASRFLRSLMHIRSTTTTLLYYFGCYRVVSCAAVFRSNPARDFLVAVVWIHSKDSGSITSTSHQPSTTQQCNRRGGVMAWLDVEHCRRGRRVHIFPGTVQKPDRSRHEAYDVRLSSSR